MTSVPVRPSYSRQHHHPALQSLFFQKTRADCPSSSCHKKNTTNLVAYKQQTLILQFWRPGSLRSRRQQTWCQIRHQDGRLHPHMMGGEGAPWGLVDKGTNPITGLPLMTSSLSKGPPSNTITWEVRISTQLLELGAWEMGGEPQPLRVRHKVMRTCS